MSFSELIGNPVINARANPFPVPDGLEWKKIGATKAPNGDEHEFEAAYTAEAAYIQVFSGAEKGAHYFSFILNMESSNKNFPSVVEGISNGVEPRQLEAFLDKFYVTLSPEDVESILVTMSKAASKHGKANRDLEKLVNT